MNKILVILGTTSTGKTDLALKLARRFNGEIIAADSRQVYKGLDLGSGKMPGVKIPVKKSHGFWEISGIKVWMYDVSSANKQYSVFDYVNDANKALTKIYSRGKLPIIVGGGGFYIKALLEGLPNLEVPRNLKLRKELEKLSLMDLQKKIQHLDPKKWEAMNYSDKHNPRRLIRAIEVAVKGKKVRKNSRPQHILKTNMLKIGLKCSRDLLYKRIDERIISRLNEGMIEEALRLYKKGLSLKRMKQLGLEYGVLADYLQGKIPGREQLINILSGKIHDYARRQITWFNRERSIYWYDITQKKWGEKVESRVNSWYHCEE